MPNFQRVQQSNIKALGDNLLFPELIRIHKPINWRVEISFSKLPKDPDRKLMHELKKVISEMIEQKNLIQDRIIHPLDIKYPITIHIRLKEHKIRFSDGDGFVLAGDNKDQLQCDYLLFENINGDNAIRGNINAALEQMPSNAEKHIFIELLPTMNVNRAIQIAHNKALDGRTRITFCKKEALFNVEQKTSWWHLYPNRKTISA